MRLRPPRLPAGHIRARALRHARTAPGAPTGLPTWRDGQAVNEWREITGSALSAVTPTNNPNGKNTVYRLDAWAGLAVDTSRNHVWSLANGGHDDYHGNCVYRLDLSSNAPAWAEWLASDATLSAPHNAGRYPSGRPASAHTYYCTQYVPQRDRVIRFGATAASTIGNSFGAVDGWNPTVSQGSNGWEPSSTYPDVPSIDLTEWPVAQNTDTGDVYVLMTNQRVSKWTQSTNTWSTVSSGFPPDGFNGRPAAYDTSRDRILCFALGGNAYTFDIGTGAYTSRTLTGPGASAITGAAAGSGMVYVPALDAYVVRRGRLTGGTIELVDAAALTVTQPATTGGASIPATPLVSGNPENVYGKWLYVPDYGGCVYIAGTNANAWFLRLH